MKSSLWLSALPQVKHIRSEDAESSHAQLPAEFEKLNLAAAHVKWDGASTFKAGDPRAVWHWDLVRVYT